MFAVYVHKPAVVKSKVPIPFVPALFIWAAKPSTSSTSGSSTTKVPVTLSKFAVSSFILPVVTPVMTDGSSASNTEIVTNSAYVLSPSSFVVTAIL